MLFSVLFFPFMGRSNKGKASECLYPILDRTIVLDKNIEDLESLALKRKILKNTFNARFNKKKFINNRFLINQSILPVFLKKRGEKTQLIYQMKIEHNDLILTHSSNHEHTPPRRTRFNISSLNLEWDIKKRQASCSSMTINLKSFENYMLFFNTIKDLQLIKQSTRLIIDEAIGLFKNSNMHEKMGGGTNIRLKNKVSQFLSKIEECDRDSYFESEYSHSMKIYHNLSKDYGSKYDLFGSQSDLMCEMDEEGWLAETKGLLKGFFISLLDHPSLIMQTDLHRLVSAIRQGLMLFSYQEDMASLFDSFLSDKNQYLLTYIAHHERVGDELVRSIGKKLNKSEFLARIKIENDLLFILNQIRDKRQYYQLEDNGFKEDISENNHDFPTCQFEGPYSDELESKFHRSLLRSFVLLHTYIDSNYGSKRFISQITDEKNTKKNLEEDIDFNIYGRWGTVGHYLEQINKNLQKDPSNPLGNHSWQFISGMIQEQKPIEEIQEYFEGLIKG